jgi:hypothetical protein
MIGFDQSVGCLNFGLVSLVGGRVSSMSMTVLAMAWAWCSVLILETMESSLIISLMWSKALTWKVFIGLVKDTAAQ